MNDIKVRPLEWDEITSPREDGPREPTGDSEAATLIGPYQVVFDADEDVAAYPWCCWTPLESLGHFASQEEAKAAAQADYERVILSAITTEAAPTAVKPPPYYTIPAHARWCQPGDRQDARQFLIRFDDPDCRDMYFTDETEARETFARLNMSWNCYLFGTLAAHPGTHKTEETLARVVGICVEAGMPPEGEVDQFEWLSKRLVSPSPEVRE